MSESRFYKGGLKLAPTKCECGRQLPKPVHGNQGRSWQERERFIALSSNEQGWHVRCKCHAVYVWSFPNIWKQRHELPLFDRNLVVPDNYQGQQLYEGLNQ